MTKIIEGISHVDTDELDAILKKPVKSNVYVIDVREPEEYEDGHIPGIPLISMGSIPDLIDRFDKEAEYVFVCRSGRRSLEVAKFFVGHNISNVHNFSGGMLAWDKEIVRGREVVLEPFSMNPLERGPAQ